jgi:hypothetical protein
VITTHPGRLVSAAAGAVVGLAAWFAFDAVRDHLPVWLRFVVAGGILTFGPGAGLTFPLLAPLTTLRRVVLALTAGLAFAPMVAHVLGTAHALRWYPYVAAALAGMAIGFWRGTEDRPHTSIRARIAALALIVVALSVGGAAFAHRLAESRTGITVYGEYDSYDLTYYAEIAAELSHTVPPASPFFAGRMLNHAFYPHVVLAMVHRFGSVPILDLYFKYAWPAFLALAMLGCFVLVESLASVETAFIAALLFGVGSNLAYLAAWFSTPAVWDEVVWSHNFQGAGAEVLLYGNWTPALASMFAGFYAIRAARKGSAGWAVVAGAIFASTVLSKPWIFASVLSAIAVVILLSRDDKPLVRRLALTAASSLLIAAPFLYRTVALYDDAQVTFEPAFLPIPLVMVDRLGLRDWFLARAGMFGFTGTAQTSAAALLALPLFLLGTIGPRVVGLPALWHCLRRPAEHDPLWRLLAWTLISAFVASSVIVSVPYHESQQIHQFALFVLALFAAKGLAHWTNRRIRIALTIIVLTCSIPGTLQYVHRKWVDRQNVTAEASRSEIALAGYLAATNPDRTSILHDRPNDPTLLGILAERRSVLSWAGYVRNSDPRRADVEAFFAGAAPDTAMRILRKYRPTHVVDYEGRDRIDPIVLGELEFVLRNGNVTLYRVPPQLLGPAE